MHKRSLSRHAHNPTNHGGASSVFLPAADIPRFVGEGNVDLGITGQDMVAEAGATVSSLITEVLELGFGKCKLQVQIPDPSHLSAVPTTAPSTPALNGGPELSASASGSSTPSGGSLPQIRNEEDLVGRKVATSFDYLAGEYFKKLDAQVTQKRIAEGKMKESDAPLKTEIEYVGGSVEAACALGLADGIVDLVGECARPQLDSDDQ